MVPEESTNEELLELEQGCVVEDEAGEKEPPGEEKEESLRKFTVNCLTKAFSNFIKF